MQTSVKKIKAKSANEDLEKEQTQINIASGHMVVQEENSEASLVSAEKAQGILVWKALLKQSLKRCKHKRVLN